MRTLCRGLIAPAVLLALCAGSLHADDARDRKARAALALASTVRPAVALAPAPRAAVTRDYGAGCKAAAEQEKPLVVFVGCPGNEVAGAVVAKTDSLGEVKAPAVVVGFPAGDRLFIHATLDCPVTPERLGASVKAAAKKINDPAPREMPAPRPLDWDVRAEPEAKANGCKCGEACPCGGAQALKPAPLAVSSDPAAACVRVSWKQYSASGTCVACEGGKSLVVTNNHLFSETYDADGQFARGGYPLACTVRPVNGAAAFSGAAIEGDRDADLAFVVVDGELPVAELADAEAAPGTPVWHKGIGSGGGKGVVLVPRSHPQPKNVFASDTPSVSGDSGAGLFDPAGRIVAVNCGRHGTAPISPQRGTPVGPIRDRLRGVARGAFPNLAERLGGKQTATAIPEPTSPGPTAAQKPAPGPASASLQPGDIVTTSGRVIRPTGRGNYVYVGDGPTAAPACPNGRCPLQR